MANKKVVDDAVKVVRHELPKYHFVRKVSTIEKKLVDGTFVTNTVVNTVDIRDRDKGLDYRDFSIDSLVASGAINDVKFSQLAGDNMAIADEFDKNI